MAAPTTNQATAIFYRIIASNGLTIGPRVDALEAICDGAQGLHRDERRNRRPEVGSED